MKSNNEIELVEIDQQEAQIIWGSGGVCTLMVYEATSNDLVSMAHDLDEQSAKGYIWDFVIWQIPILVKFYKSVPKLTTTKKKITDPLLDVVNKLSIKRQCSRSEIFELLTLIRDEVEETSDQVIKNNDSLVRCESILDRCLSKLDTVIEKFE